MAEKPFNMLTPPERFYGMCQYMHHLHIMEVLLPAPMLLFTRKAILLHGQSPINQAGDLETLGTLLQRDTIITFLALKRVLCPARFPFPVLRTEHYNKKKLQPKLISRPEGDLSVIFGKYKVAIFSVMVSTE